MIGGGLTSLGEELLDGVNGVLDEWASESSFVDSLQLGDRIALVPPGLPAAFGASIVGARVRA